MGKEYSKAGKLDDLLGYVIIGNDFTSFILFLTHENMGTETDIRCPTCPLFIL